MDTQLFPANALTTRNTYSMCHTCLVLAMQLSGYAVVNTSPPPWNMLVGKNVAAWLCGYTVVNTCSPP